VIHRKNPPFSFYRPKEGKTRKMAGKPLFSLDFPSMLATFKRPKAHPQSLTDGGLYSVRRVKARGKLAEKR